VVPNPKLEPMDQVREVLRVKHYPIRTEQAHCGWISRYVRFHGMRSRENLFPGTDKVELFLSEKPAGLFVKIATAPPRHHGGTAARSAGMGRTRRGQNAADSAASGAS